MARVKLPLPSEFKFSTEVQVRINDINYAGHLSNDKFQVLMHEARVRYLNQFGFKELDVAGRGIIMVDTVILYKAEAFYGEIIRIELTTDEFHKYGCDIFYKFTNSKTGKEVARAKTGILFFDYEKRKIAEVPGKFIELCSSLNYSPQRSLRAQSLNNIK